MRLLMLCIVLACIIAVKATDQPKEEAPRQKRDLQFWKNLIAAKLGLVEAKPNDEEVKILRIPGFENVLVRAVPKVSVVDAPPPTIIQEKIVQVDPTLALLGAYLGTKTPEETLIALQRVKGLLQSGIIKARDEVIEVMPPKPPVYVLPSIIQAMKDCPKIMPGVSIVHEKPMYPFLPPMFPVSAPMYPIPQPVMPVPALRPLPMPVLRPVPVPVMPAPIQVMKPLPQIKPLPFEPMVPVELVPTHYSYHQLKDGTVTSFLSEGSQDVIVTQTKSPLPPPPRYIIDRFQKMIFGLPLGVTTIRPTLPPIPVVVPKPIVNIPFLPLMPGPVIPQPAPVITKPAIVDVKVGNDKKKLYQGSINMFAGTRVMKEPFTSTLVQEEVVVPAPLLVDVPVKSIPDAPVIIDATKPDSGFSYKHVHGDGTMTTYTGTAAMKEPVVVVEDLSKLPTPPPEIVHRIEEAAGRAHHPKSMRAYAFKISNGVGYFENGINDKIFYSRLLSGSGDKHGPIVPDPLSSQDNKEDLRDRNKNVYVIDDDKPKENNQDEDSSEKDELGNPFLSTKINGNNKDSSDSKGFSEIKDDIEKEKEEGHKNSPIKKMPPLPTPIVGENEKSERPKVKALGYSYTLLRKDGPLRFGGNTREPTPEKITPDFDLSKKNDGDSGTFSYTQIEGGKVTPMSKGANGESIMVMESIKDIPTTVVDVVQPLPKPGQVTKNVSQFPKEIIGVVQPRPVIHNVEIPKNLIDVVQPLPKPVIMHKNVPHFPKAVIDVVRLLPKPGPVLMAERIKNIPVMPSAIVDVVQPKPVEVAVVGEKDSGVLFSKPVVSSYVYKQISHSNRQPFTVVQVGDQPTIEVPRGDVHVKVNQHEHIRADGTRYPCREVHLAPEISIAPIPTISSSGMTATIPSGLLYVPPTTADVPPPTGHIKQEIGHFSYTQVSSNDKTTTSQMEAPKTTTEKPLSLSLNPIVVAEESNYSYTQTKGDGSSINIQGNKDNTVSVKIDGNSQRGDIPDALA